MKEVMKYRNKADMEMRCQWSARITHAALQCRNAVDQICANAGASAHMIDNPLQKVQRDMNTAACHAVFDKEMRYGDLGSILLEQPVKGFLV